MQLHYFHSFSPKHREKKIKTIFCSCSCEIHKQMRTTTKASDEYSVRKQELFLTKLKLIPCTFSEFCSKSTFAMSLKEKRQ